MNWSVGATYCMMPNHVSGTRVVAVPNSSSGSAVSGPEIIASVINDGLENNTAVASRYNQVR